MAHRAAGIAQQANLSSGEGRSARPVTGFDETPVPRNAPRARAASARTPRQSDIRIAVSTSYRPIIFKDYCLLERVSVGGMAEVYRARRFGEANLRRFLAVKRILPNLAEDKEFISMFIDEAKVSIQLNHPNVCQMYELGRLNDSYYIVMEFISGRDLLAMQNRFRKQKRIMSVSQAAFIIAEVCEGLDYAHRKVDDDGREMNIIHRDISPQNILVGFDGQVKVIDFGIARAATKSQQTQVGVLKGKFGYMSPEQVAAGPIDHRSDIFAVGALFWELLTARRLFHGETDYATLEKVRHARVMPPSKKNPNIPEEIDRIVLKALARKPEDRYQSAGALGRDLRRFLKAVKPPYTKDTLSNWMVNAFKEHVQTEREKIADFQSFVNPDDVRRYNEAQLSSVGGEVLDLEELQAEIEEATRVYDIAAGAAGEVFAAGSAGDGTAVLEEDVALRADSGLSTDPGHEASTTGRRGHTLGLRRRRSRTVPLIAATAVLIAALAAAVVFVLLPRGGTLELTVFPAEDLVVLLDGSAVDATPPIILERIPAGTRTVEVRHQDHEPLFEEFEVGAGETVRITRELTPLRGGEASVRFELSGDDVEFFVNGQPSEATEDGMDRILTVPAGEPVVIEVFRPGHFIEEFEIEARRDDELRRALSLRPVQGSLSIGSTPAGTVYLDGEQKGVTTTRLHLTELDFHRAYQLEIRPRSRGFRTYEQPIVFDTIPDLRIQPRLRRIGEDDSGAGVEFGWLTVEPHDGRFFRLIVDGRDAGINTPIDDDGRIALRAGERVLEFVRGQERRTLRVTIADQEVTAVAVPDAEP